MTVVSVYDKISQTYSQPSFFPNFDAAKRAIAYQFKNDPMLSLNAKDFVLCEIAHWDPKDGTLIPSSSPGDEINSVSLEVLLNVREEV